MQPIALPLHLNDLSVREKAVEDGGRRWDIAQKLPPVLRRAIRRNQRRGGIVPSHEDLEQVFGRRRSQALHAEILEDEEIDVRESLHEIAPLAFGVRFRKILREVERAPDKRVIPRPNRADGDGHRDVRFAHTRWPNQERAVMRANESRGREVDQLRPRDLRIERPIERRELRHLGNAGLFEAPHEEPIGASGQLVLDEQIEKVEILQRGGLCLDRKSTRLNSSHIQKSRMPSSA